MLNNTEDLRLALYKRMTPMFNRISRRYTQLDRAVDQEDLLQACYEGMATALQKYRNTSSVGRLPVVCTFYAQKACAKLCPSDDKYVELYDRVTSQPIKRLTYATFQKQKRSLPANIEYTIVNRRIDIEDAKDLEKLSGLEREMIDEMWTELERGMEAYERQNEIDNNAA